MDARLLTLCSVAADWMEDYFAQLESAVARNDVAEINALVNWGLKKWSER